jgi:paraquat-inducible protein B
MAAERQTAIGVFVFGGLVLGLAAIVLFGNFRPFSPTTRAVVVFQGSISGLSVGAPVTFRGVRVGAVETISLVFDPKTRTAYIPVIVQLEPERVLVAGEGDQGMRTIGVANAVGAGLRAELNVQSFVTGQSQIDLDFDTSVPPVYHPNVTNLPEIPTRLSTIQRAQEQLSQLPLGEMAANANEALKSIRDLAAKLDVDLPPLVASLKTTSDGSSRTIDATTEAIGDLKGRLDDTLTRLTQLLTNGNEQMNQRSADLHKMLGTATQTMQQASDVLIDLRSLTSTRGETRTNLDATLRDLAAASASLRGFANAVEHNPQLLLTGRRP